MNQNNLDEKIKNKTWFRVTPLQEFKEQFKDLSELPSDFDLSLQVDDELFQVDSLLEKYDVNKFIDPPFNAEQWKKFFKMYTQVDFLTQSSRSLTSRIHHILRIIIMKQTFRVIFFFFSFKIKTKRKILNSTNTMFFYNKVCKRDYFYLAKDHQTVVQIDKDFIHQQLCRTKKYKSKILVFFFLFLNS